MAVAVACAAVLACGTVLDIASDEPGGGADASVEVSGQGDSRPGDDGGVSPPDADADAGAPTGVPLGNLLITLEPAMVDVLAGGAAGLVNVKVVRPPGDTTLVSATFSAPSGIVIPNIAAFTGVVASTSVTADSMATPRRLAVDVVVTAGTALATLQLVIRVAAELRAPTSPSFFLQTAQTYAIAAWGAGGPPSTGGGGGFVAGDVSVAAGETMAVLVGSAGTEAIAAGTPGGGTGGNYTGGAGTAGGGGGGYSGVFIGGTATFLNARLIAGAGGGGATDGSSIIRRGGGGGSAGASAAQSGENGGGGGGGGGSTTSFGVAGGSGDNGGRLFGGAGFTDVTNGGGGGGGGYYGGGGGGVGSGGGGGGSLTPAGGTSLPGTTLLAGNNADPRRQTAGNPGRAGAVLIVPK